MSRCALVSRSHALTGTESAETQCPVGTAEEDQGPGVPSHVLGAGLEHRVTLSLVGAPAEPLAGDWFWQSLKLFQPLRGGLVGGANLGLPSLVMKPETVSLPRTLREPD